ncbi:MAG TPA: hypothetical protein VHX88_20095 [Solirubrobacteraceae bacterium]|nr:hypothetical protein [Solirubrobacteraceae bacterium]
MAVGGGGPPAAEPLEGLEQPLELIRGDERPGVGDRQQRVSVGRAGADLDAPGGVVVPDRVVDQATGLFAAGYVQISGADIAPGLLVTDSQG